MEKPTLEPLCDDVWRAQSHIKMLPGFGLPLSMTLISTPDGLILHSPFRINDDLAEEIESIGKPCALIAPNLFHHLYVAGAKRRYADADVFGPEALAKKNPKLAELTPLETCDAPWTEHLRPIRIAGIPRVREFAFFHVASGTLLVTDLVFNLDHADGWISNLYLRWSDALGKPMQTKIWRLITKDRRAARSSLEALLELDIQRVVVGHGDVIEDSVIEGDVQTQLRHAWQWILQSAK